MEIYHVIFIGNPWLSLSMFWPLHLIKQDSTVNTPSMVEKGLNVQCKHRKS